MIRQDRRMARWDLNWQGAVQGHSGRRLRRSPRRGGPIQGGKAVLSAPLNRTVGRDPLASRPSYPGRGKPRRVCEPSHELRAGRRRAGHIPQSPTRRWSSASARGSCARGLPGRAVPFPSARPAFFGEQAGESAPLGARRGGSVGARCRERSAAHPRLPPCHTSSITVVVGRSTRKRRCQDNTTDFTVDVVIRPA